MSPSPVPAASAHLSRAPSPRPAPVRSRCPSPARGSERGAGTHRPCPARRRARPAPPTAGSRPAAPACAGTRPSPSCRHVQEWTVLHVPGKHFDELRIEPRAPHCQRVRSEEHTSELQSLMRISYAVFCLKKKKKKNKQDKRKT